MHIRAKDKIFIRRGATRMHALASVSVGFFRMECFAFFRPEVERFYKS